MEKTIQSAQVVRFATFEVDLEAGELRKAGLRLRFTGQPFQVLAILLEQPGTIVTREQLQKRLWPNTFVDVDHNLNSAINRIREALGDSAENPRFVETLPRRGYRFIARIDCSLHVQAIEEACQDSERKPAAQARTFRFWALLSGIAVLLLAGTGLFIREWERVATSSAPHPLTRFTFDAGLQIEPTWSPDGRFIAYSSNHGGKFDIWVQQVSGGNPLQITQGPGNHWQPDWSPDGKYIVYRSEAGEGGLYVIPALGGAGLERQVASFGYHPRWSPNSWQILFDTQFHVVIGARDRFYVVDVDGGAPREVGAGFFSLGTAEVEGRAISAAWHPDGKRISIWAGGWTYIPTIWIVAIADGAATKIEIPPRIQGQLVEVGLGAGQFEGGWDFKFSWAPSGTGIYFERTFRGARNVWRMSIDPRTARAVTLERITTGPGNDTDPSLSPDGKKLAFAAESSHVRAWIFPFDGIRGRITGAGRAVTSAAMLACNNVLSRNGKRLAFVGSLAGQQQLWEKSLPDGPEAPIVALDSYIRSAPRLSSDGTKLAYQRRQLSTGYRQLMIWSTQSRNEEPLTTPRNKYSIYPFDWSPDGNSLLISEMNPDTLRREVWQLPVGAGPYAKDAEHKIISDPDYGFYHPSFSWDGRWIVFQAVRDVSNNVESSLYVISTSGGSRIRITEGHPWDAKPSWSPDGKTIYFISRRGGAFNVWGIRFDPVKGNSVGEPFAVTSFENSGPTVPDSMPDVELSVTDDKLVLTMEERFGNLWILDTLDR